MIPNHVNKLTNQGYFQHLIILPTIETCKENFTASKNHLVCFWMPEFHIFISSLLRSKGFCFCHKYNSIFLTLPEAEQQQYFIFFDSSIQIIFNISGKETKDIHRALNKNQQQKN